MSRISCMIALLLCMPSYGYGLGTFSAEYEIYYGDYSLGHGRYHLQNTDNGRYRFSFDSKLRFLLLFTDERKIVSEFRLDNHQVTPIFFALKRAGTGPNYKEDISFDRDSSEIRSQYKEESISIDYDAEIRDSLSIQLQLLLDLRRGYEYPQYVLMEKNKLQKLNFERIKEETIEVAGKLFRCVLYQVSRRNKNLKTRMWFAIDHNFQPVLMAHFNNDKKRFNARLISYQEEQQELNSAQESELQVVKKTYY